MKKSTCILLSIIFSLHILYAQNMSSYDRVNSYIKKIKDKYVPDTREAIFDVRLVSDSDTLVLEGVTSDKDSYKELSNIEKELVTVPVVSNVRLLPSSLLQDKLYGVVNVSVADIRTQNRFTSGMATQALLGTPIKLYDYDGWYRIQLPDSYFGWAHEKQIVLMNEIEMKCWLNAPKIIFTDHYGFAYEYPDQEGAVVADLVVGNILQYDGLDGDYFKVIYPDGRKGYVLQNSARRYDQWLQSIEVSAESFIKTARSMMGIPYVWGGTSTKGLDCSGLVSTVMNLHGLYILRDASQQARVGDEVDISTGYEKLKPGDLMFFGEKGDEKNKESIRHVGFYLGGKRFIHASGWVRVSSLDSNDAEYDELNTKEFVKATRIINNGELIGVERIVDNKFYQIQIQ